ncbi:MAG: DegT/DnrJ/EryC1/StrS family aminotransferase [Chloroflexi bacterium]|nr:DegT/DnrJ/EryC1/StrS family aminotransferase [Chloroflexota bacterium]
MVIRVCEPSIGQEEIKNAIEALKSTHISGTSGRFIPEFEEAFAAYCNAPYGVSVNSGTAALHLAVDAFDIGKGDEVILPTFTNIATALAVVYCDAKPVLVDAERDTWNMDVSQVEAKITPRTRAILVVHIYGHPVDMDPVLDMARRHNLLVIEDAAEAHGAQYKSKIVGCLGDAGCFSFYANKIVTTGEGGMIVTNNVEMAEKARIKRDLAFEKPTRFLHRFTGYNYRMPNIQAGIGLAQLHRIDEIIEKKRALAHRYNKILGEVDGITLPVEKPWAKNVYWMYSILVEDSYGMSRDDLRVRLEEKGIESRTFFIGMHAQPAFHKLGLFQGESYPVCDEIARRGLYLPSGVDLRPDEITYVAETIRGLRR